MDITPRGNKIYKIYIRLYRWEKNNQYCIVSYIVVCYFRITFLDTLLLCGSSLRKLKTSLGLKSEAKGFWPHTLTNAKNRHLYLTHHPPVSYYCPERMNAAEQAEFFSWYQEVKQQPFDFNQMLCNYCVSGKFSFTLLKTSFR